MPVSKATAVRVIQSLPTSEDRLVILSAAIGEPVTQETFDAIVAKLKESADPCIECASSTLLQRIDPSDVAAAIEFAIVPITAALADTSSRRNISEIQRNALKSTADANVTAIRALSIAAHNAAAPCENCAIIEARLVKQHVKQ